MLSGSFRWFHIRVNFVQRERATIVLHDATMKASQSAGFRHAAGMGDDANFLAHVFRILSYAFCLVFGYQSALQFFVVRRNPGRSGVLVALKGRNAAERKHETACSINEVCANA